MSTKAKLCAILTDNRIGLNMVTIRISEMSLLTMVLNGIEAYAVMNSNRKRARENTKLETIGHMYGYSRETDDEKYYYIDYVSIDTTALQKSDAVGEYEDSRNLKNDIIKSYWAHLENLGSFHSHPYNNLQEVQEKKGYYGSDQDRETMEADGEKIAIILTIATLGKKRDNGTRYKDGHSNCFQFTLGKLRLWLTAYATYKNEDGKIICTDDKTENVTIDCPVLAGLKWEHCTPETI